MANVIYSGNPGNLPYTFEYTPERDTPSLIQLSGSAWTTAANTKIGLQVSIEGNAVTTASMFSNGANTHRALNAGLAEFTFPIKIEGGAIKPVQIEISALRGTKFDVNDEVSLVVF